MAVLLTADPSGASLPREQQVVRGNGRRYVGIRLSDEISALFRRDVFQNDFQSG